MSEKRVVERVFDTDGNIVEENSREISDAELSIEQVETETAAANDEALNAWLGWNSLPTSKKLAWIKMLLGDFVSRNRDNYIRP